MNTILEPLGCKTGEDLHLSHRNLNTMVDVMQKIVSFAFSFLGLRFYSQFGLQGPISWQWVCIESSDSSTLNGWHTTTCANDGPTHWCSCCGAQWVIPNFATKFNFCWTKFHFSNKIDFRTKVNYFWQSSILLNKIRVCSHSQFCFGQSSILLVNVKCVPNLIR